MEKKSHPSQRGRVSYNRRLARFISVNYIQTFINECFKSTGMAKRLIPVKYVIFAYPSVMRVFCVWSRSTSSAPIIRIHSVALIATAQTVSPPECSLRPNIESYTWIVLNSPEWPAGRMFQWAWPQRLLNKRYTWRLRRHETADPILNSCYLGHS